VSAISGGEADLRGLMGVAFAGGEPALPDVDSVLAEVETLGSRLRHRQRVRTGVATAALCVAAFGMVAGIAVMAHSTSSSTPLAPGGGVVVNTTDQVPPDLGSTDTGP
jgi:hypothetical protein